MTASTESSTQSHHDEKEAIAPARLVAYALGNFGQSAFYNALSTYFVVYVTNSLFSGVDKAVAGKLIGIITSLIVIIRIAEIFVDPLLGNLVDNTTTKLGRFRPWQLIGGLVSAVLIVMVYTGLFGLVNVNTTLFIVLFVVVFVVLDVFYSLRDISYWGMIPSISSDSPSARHLHRSRHLHRIARVQRSDYRRDAHRHLLQLRCRPAEPEWLDRVHHHRGPARRSHGSECSVRCQGKTEHAAHQGPGER